MLTRQESLNPPSSSSYYNNNNGNGGGGNIGGGGQTSPHMIRSMQKKYSKSIDCTHYLTNAKDRFVFLVSVVKFLFFIIVKNDLNNVFTRY
jgi:hypothetical protein